MINTCESAISRSATTCIAAIEDLEQQAAAQDE